MTDAAFRACYAEWKVIKTRAAVQLVFEIPIEQADEAYQALGGMPIAANEVWCGIARLDEKKLAGSSAVESLTVNQVVAGSSPARSAKRKFDEMTQPAQAGMLANDFTFQRFLQEQFRDEWDDSIDDMRNGDERQALGGNEIASQCIRKLCGVTSRRFLAENERWTSLVLAYRLWQREPSVVPA